MGNHMDHILNNTNQLRHYGIKVQDNPKSDSALLIVTEDNEFCMELAMAGTVVYADTFTLSEQELHQCPHIILSLTNAWDPKNMVLPRARISLEEAMGTLRHVSAIDITGGGDQKRI